MMMTVGKRIRVTSALFLAAVLLLSGIVGCSTVPPPAPSPAPTPAPTPTPTGPTGSLVIAVQTMGTERWSPLVAAATEMSIAGAIYEFLIHRKPGGIELTPGVAERWEMSKDGLTWTFYLRKGIQFHGDWGELTAQDVKRTYEEMAGEKANSFMTPFLRANVKSVEAVNPYQVVFRMKTPSWDLGYRLSNGVAYFGIMSSKYLDSVGLDVAAQKPIGSGPYKFVEHKAGQYIKLEALEKHWRQVPYYKTLTFKPVPEEVTRIAMLKTGEADIAEITQASVPDLEKAGLKIVQIPNAKSTALQFGGMVLPTRPTYDPKIPWVGSDREKGLKVRKAIALAINKEDILKYVLGGVGQPLVTQYFLPDMPQTDPAWKPYPYDPEQSKKLLAEAGYPSGFDLTILDVAFAGRPEIGAIAEAVSLQLGKVGIRTKIQKMELPVFRKMAQARELGQILFPLSVSRFDEPVIISDIISASRVSLMQGIEDTKVDQFIAAGLAELDYDKRLRLQREMGQYLIDNYLYVGIASLPTLFGANKKVGEWPLTPAMAYGFYYEYIKPGAK